MSEKIPAMNVRVRTSIYKSQIERIKETIEKMFFELKYGDL